MIKKIHCFFSWVLLFLAVFALFSISTLSVFAESKEVCEIDLDFGDNAKAIYLYSFDANRVLYEKGLSDALAPASTVKIMTGLIACREFKNSLEDDVEITPEMVKDVSGVSMQLKVGEKIKIRDLLYGAICGSNNDAAQAIAVLSSGSVSSFVKKMNTEAKRLKMNDTAYVNPTGMDAEGATTTISDVALLSKEAIKNDLYLEISSTRSYIYASSNGEMKKISNRNALISEFSAKNYLNKNAKGLIAGGTDEGGYVCSAFAENEGMKYLCIVMGANEEQNGDNTVYYSYYIANKLLNYSFKTYTNKRIFKKNDVLGKAPTELALLENDKTEVPCVLANDVYAFIPYDVSEQDIVAKPFLYNDIYTAPLKQGTSVGYVNIYYKDILIAREELVLRDDVSKNTVLSILDTMKNIFSSRIFILFAVIFIPFLVVFLIIDAKKNRHKRVKEIRFGKFK